MLYAIGRICGIATLLLAGLPARWRAPQLKRLDVSGSRYLPPAPPLPRVSGETRSQQPRCHPRYEQHLSQHLSCRFITFSSHRAFSMPLIAFFKACNLLPICVSQQISPLLSLFLASSQNGGEPLKTEIHIK